MGAPVRPHRPHMPKSASENDSETFVYSNLGYRLHDQYLQKKITFNRNCAANLTTVYWYAAAKFYIRARLA